MKVVGFLVSTEVDKDVLIGFFVGFVLGLAGVVLSHGEGRGFVTKFGSVETCQGVDDHVSEKILIKAF